jgi:hypothetical protein
MSIKGDKSCQAQQFECVHCSVIVCHLVTSVEVQTMAKIQVNTRSGNGCVQLECGAVIEGVGEYGETVGHKEESNNEETV